MNIFEYAKFKKIFGGSGGSGGGSEFVVCEDGQPNGVFLLNTFKDLKVSCPNAYEIFVRAFEGCDTIVSIDLPLVTKIYDYAFCSCTSLTTINLPLVKTVGDNAFLLCTSLKSIDLPNATRIGPGAFDTCTSLDTLILRTTETVCVIDFAAFDNASFLYDPSTGTNKGYIYVPSVMYEYYRAGYIEALDGALGEGAFDRIVRKIEDYPEICG